MIPTRAADIEENLFRPIPQVPTWPELAIPGNLRITARVTNALPAEAVGRAEVRRDEVGRVRVALQGRFDARSTAEVWRTLEEQLGAESVAALEIDATGLEQADGSGMALLHYLDMGGMSP